MKIIFASAAFFLFANVTTVQSCYFSPSFVNVGNDRNSNKGKITPKPKIKDNQSLTPPLPTPVSSTCGHSQYYHSPNDFLAGSSIIGGITAQPNQYPWLARLSVKVGSRAYVCGASVISENYLLTAAHCILFTTSLAHDITVVFGDHSYLSQDENQFSLAGSRIKIHPLYNSSSPSSEFDLGLLKLPKPLNFKSSWAVQKICLPTSCRDGCSAGTTAYIAGWGTASPHDNEVSQYLQTAYVKIADQKVCRRQYSDLTDGMICAGYIAGGVDTCLGDSGGPLMVVENGYYKLCGVTSFGNGCGLPHFYGVYSRVCTVIEWIKLNTDVQ